MKLQFRCKKHDEVLKVVDAEDSNDLVVPERLCDVDRSITYGSPEDKMTGLYIFDLSVCECPKWTEASGCQNTWYVQLVDVPIARNT